MASVSLTQIILTLITSLTFGVFVYFSIKVHRAKGSLAWRGIVKLVSLNGIPESLALLYSKWFAALCIFFVTGCILVAYLVWATDHSFFVVIFPLLFYYFFARFFLWEKADLTE